MSIIAAALRELMGAGLSGEALVAAVERIENAARPVRTPGAIRQQRYRETHPASQNVTSDAGDVSDGANTPSPEKEHSTPILPTPQENPPKGGQKKGCALPADFIAKPKHYDLGASLGRPRSWVDGVLELMREWAGANSNRNVGRKADWDLTLNSFIRRENQNPRSPLASLKAQPEQATGPPQPPPGARTRDEIMADWNRNAMQ